MSGSVTPPEIDRARKMLRTEFWRRYTRYLVARREHLLATPAVGLEAKCERDGAIAEITRQLRGEAFMIEVIRGEEERRRAEASGEAIPSAPPEPTWLNDLRAGSDVVE